jgi:hypothetical protein
VLGNGLTDRRLHHSVVPDAHNPKLTAQFGFWRRNTIFAIIEHSLDLGKFSKFYNDFEKLMIF